MANIKNVTDDAFAAEVLDHKGPVVVDFWAEWCGPCKALGPILEQVSSEVKGVKVVKLNIDENMEAPIQYGVRGIPTMIAFKDGKPVSNLVGLQEPATLKNWLASL